MQKVELQLENKKLQVYLKERTHLIKTHQLEEYELVQLYQQAIQLLMNFKEQDYWILRKLLNTHKYILSKEDESRFLKYLISAAYILYLNKPQKDRYLQEIYVLHEIGFSEEIFTHDGFLGTDLLINYIVISIDYRQWLNYKKDTKTLLKLPNLYTIITDNMDKLYEDDKELTVILATAYTFYYDNNYQTTLDKVNLYMQRETLENEKKATTSIKDDIEINEDKKPKSYRTIANKLRIRCLKIRIYFEQSDFDGFLTCSKRFKKFLQENKVGFSEKQKTAHLNFIQLACDILEEKRPKDVLLNHIKEQKLLACRNWLKIQLLKSNNSKSDNRTEIFNQ